MSDLEVNKGLLKALGRADEFVKLGEYYQAIDVCEKMLSDNSEQVVALKNVGLFYLKMGKVGKAIECLGKAVELEPNNIDLQEQLQAAIKELEAKPKMEWPI